jgi:hypothetical protein
MGQMRNIYIKFCSGNLKGRDHLENRSVDRTIILKWILQEQDVKVLLGFMWLRLGTSAGLL